MQMYNQQTLSSGPAPVYADIGQQFDVLGDSIFNPQTAGKSSEDPLKYLYDMGLLEKSNIAHAAEGGSIDDLLEYLRS
jgi:uncharacterized protein YfkK (UPF0435 family)